MLSLAECSALPALFDAEQVNCPPSSTMTRLMFTWLTTSPGNVRKGEEIASSTRVQEGNFNSFLTVDSDILADQIPKENEKIVHN